MPAAMLWNEEEVFIRPAIRTRIQALNPRIADHCIADHRIADPRSDQRRGSPALGRPHEVAAFARWHARPA